MNYVIMIVLLISFLRILELQKRISQLEGHNPANRNKSVLLNRSNTAIPSTPVFDGAHVYVIPDMTKKRS